MREKLLEKANKLPMLPGVYIMLDATGQVIYVGKAKKLKNRVTSYFRGSHLPKVEAMVQKVTTLTLLSSTLSLSRLFLKIRSLSSISRTITSCSRMIRAIRL